MLYVATDNSKNGFGLHSVKKTYGNFLDNFLGQYGLLKKFQSIFNKTICTQWTNYTKC